MSMSLSELLRHSKHVMFDFDGPVCSIFAGRPAPEVAQRLRELVQESAEVSGNLLTTIDPLEFFQAAPMMSAAVADKVREQLRAEELAAIESAEPTRGAHEAIAACHGAGKAVTVVSNNDADAVEAYLAQHGLGLYVRFVSARRSPDPKLMKPSPHLVLAAIEVSSQLPEHSVLIGDSVTDVEAARAAGSAAVGYANKPGKHERLRAAGADVIVTDMEEVANSVT